MNRKPDAGDVILEAEHLKKTGRLAQGIWLAGVLMISPAGEVWGPGHEECSGQRLRGSEYPLTGPCCCCVCHNIR
jgi:hypothetical protein